MAFAHLCHNSQTLRAANMRGCWVLLLASVCLGDYCSDIPCEVTENNVCGYDETNNLNAFFVTNCVMEQCNCHYDAVESSARFMKQDVGNCTKDPYVSLIDECSSDNSSEVGSEEGEIPASGEEVLQSKDSDGDLMPEDSLENKKVTKGEDGIASDILDTSKDEIIPVLSIFPPKEINPVEDSEENDSGSHQSEDETIPVLSIHPPMQIDPLEVSEENDSGSHQSEDETIPVLSIHPPMEIDPLEVSEENDSGSHQSEGETIPLLSIHPPKEIDPLEVSEENDSGSHQSEEETIPLLSIHPPKEIDPLEVSEENDSGSHEDSRPFIIDEGRSPPIPPPLELGKLVSILLQGLAGNLGQSVERKQEPSGQTIIEADIKVNVYIDGKIPSPPHHKHHGHHSREDSQEQSDKPTYEIKTPMGFEDSELPTFTNVKAPVPFADSELPIPSAVQYATAGSATPNLDVLAMLLTSILAILWGRS